MNRRQFLKTSAATAALTAATGLPLTAASPAVRSENRSKTTKIASYYFAAYIYMSNPRHIREDMEWMAGIGTDYVCISNLEQDLFAAYENVALIIAEAERVGMRVISVPSRWAGLVAGAPKVPSLFSVLNPKTWIVNAKGNTRMMTRATGAISSVHSPETYDFFCESLAELYKQHPTLAGFIIDEPKGFVIDHSKQAVAALGKNAPRAAHLAAAGDFYGRVCEFAKKKWPDKYTIMFQQAHYPQDELAAGAAVKFLDFYGADGRPWGMEEDSRMEQNQEGQESGRGKVLLSGRGESFIKAARSVPGRKSFLLAENHNLKASMLEPMERNYPAVLALRPDLFTYYYYPRSMEQPDRAMKIIGDNIKKFTQSS
ncbi:twin-arginine translocation signal domain-containing protein [Termitidicoccus mucosus]|uniref:Twin-arginine translocation signal domain-containing protein n=1 Tax=Termitidicoccus mucosus TaxID=1184151 RepID=A0A178ILH0_9BACT|nr:hypothetical protein AW736_09630 [Opitutaceae bacterium TSB47]